MGLAHPVDIRIASLRQASKAAMSLSGEYTSRLFLSFRRVFKNGREQLRLYINIQSVCQSVSQSVSLSATEGERERERERGY